MITPVAGIQDLVSLLDDIVKNRPHLPSLVVAVTSSDGCETARGFLEGYHRRLSVDGVGALVPHAWGSGQLLATVAQHAMPDVELLNQLAGQLSATIPPGAGRRWRPSLFETCHDVITANGVRPGQITDQRRQLRDHLYSAREERTPWLAWIQKMAVSPSMPGKTLGLVATAVFSGPSRWWFGRCLNSSKWRWFGEHVKPVTGLQGNFLDHALKVIPVGEQRDNDSLRRRILVDALLHDLDHLVRHKRFFPHRRRRRWTPVVSLDCAAELGLVCLDVARSFIALTENKPVSPLLVIAAMEPDTLESAAGTPQPVKDAIELLQKYVNDTPSVLTSKPWLPVLLAFEPGDRPAGDWLDAHRKVTPRIPGKGSAWAPVAITTVMALAATAVVTYQYLFGYCTDTWINDHGELVGLSDGRCEFSPVSVDSSGHYPDLRELEKQIRENNGAVDDMKDATGAPRYYRKVVFFAPLTRPKLAERTAPPSALWQLRGAVNAQKRLNEAATTNVEKFPIKLMLANSGDLFNDGPDVAAVIAQQPLTGPGSVAAVIGISQSREKPREAFRRMSNIPVIGASLVGNKMTEGNSNFFMVAPPNDVIARKMTDWVHDHKAEKKYTSAVIVYDPDDTYYSVDLRDSLRTYLPNEIQLLTDGIELGEKFSTSDTKSIAKQLCDHAVAGVLPVSASRADQLRKLFTDAEDEPTCRNNKITMLAGYGAVVAVASGQLDQYKWLNLAYTAVAGTAAESDEATGNDALQAASEAINKNALVSDNNPSAGGVLYQLGQGFTVNGKTGTFTMTATDHKDPTTNRIQILETNPNS